MTSEQPRTAAGRALRERHWKLPEMMDDEVLAAILAIEREARAQGIDMASEGALLLAHDSTPPLHGRIVGPPATLGYECGTADPDCGRSGCPIHLPRRTPPSDSRKQKADPPALDVGRLARALHIGGVTTGGASHPESCNSTWHLEQANRVGFLYDNAITTRLEGQPVAEGRE